MTRKQRSGTFSTTLSSGVSNGTTSWSVASAAGMPSEGDFYAICDDEIVLITHRVTTTLTVIRGQAGTSAAAHSTPAVVESIITAEEYENRVREAKQLKAMPYGSKLREGNTTQMTTSDYTTLNHGGGSFLDGNDGVLVYRSRFQTGDDLSGFLREIIDSTDGDKLYTCHIGSPVFEGANEGSHFGMHLFQESDGFIWGQELYSNNEIRIATRPNFLTAGTPVASNGSLAKDDVWMQCKVEWGAGTGSNELVTFSYSWDGVHFLDFHTFDTALSESPGVRVGCLCSNRFLADAHFFCFSWYEEDI